MQNCIHCVLFGTIVPMALPATTGTEDGLRERKKRRTRAALHGAAMRLFAERGYEATTVADIAAAADVAPRTFFAYFPVKEDVVYAAYEHKLTRFDELLAARAPGTTTVDALRAWITELADDPPLTLDEEELIARLTAEHEALAERRLGLMRRMEDALTREIARDLGPAGEPLQARMAAAAAVAVLSAMDPTACDPNGDPLDDDEKTAVLERAFAFLDAGLAAWRPASG